LKYRTTASFDDGFAKLPKEHRALFLAAVIDHLLPALATGAHRGEIPWPRRLRIHKIADAYSLTWSFAHPDGRVLFIIGRDRDPKLTWIAVGYDDIAVALTRLRETTADGAFDLALLADKANYRR
jgi:hypothetical protein